MRVYMSVLLLPIIALGVMSTTVSAEAVGATTSASCTPTIKASEVKKERVTLSVTCTQMKGKKATVKVAVINKDNDNKVKTRTFKGKFNAAGVMKIKVDKLRSGNAYSLKAAVRETSKAGYGAYSGAIETETDGDSLKVKIDKITTTANSATITIAAEDLEKKEVMVQVAYRKSSSWNTQDFTVALDSDGEAKVTVTGLAGDEEYDFKVRLKRTTDSDYGYYSEVKSKETD
jgi:hypothetical protein